VNEVLIKLNEALEFCLAKTRELKDNTEKLNSLLAVQKEKDTGLTTREILLNARELAVKKVEDVVALEAQVKADLGRLDVGRKELKAQSESFYTWMEQTKNEILADKSRLIDKEKAIDGQMKAIIAAGEALAEERKKLMENIIAQINKLR
jgi:hypothetical protein